MRLPPRLVCIIGPRGSGKSTLAEAIRVGVGGSSNATKARADLIRANLGSAVLHLTTAGDDGQPRYTVRRTVGQPPSLVSSDRRQVSSIDLDRGTFLPLDGYSSSEIEAIADESLGERRRALLDELRPGELQAIPLDVAGLRRALEANADAIRTERTPCPVSTRRACWRSNRRGGNFRATSPGSRRKESSSSPRRAATTSTGNSPTW